MDAMEELVARDRIHQLADRYAIAVDGKDLAALSMLFVEDVKNGRYGPGREGVKVFYDNILRPFHCSMHMVGNHVIDFDDDSQAHGIVYCRAHHHVLEPEHWFDMSLAYWDTYERHGDAWFFRRRNLKSWYRQEFGHPSHGTERVLAEPGARGPQRGARMPEAFATFEEFWSHEPAVIPSAS
jgi:hypothetical protein